MQWKPYVALITSPLNLTFSELNWSELMTMTTADKVSRTASFLPLPCSTHTCSHTPLMYKHEQLDGIILLNPHQLDTWLLNFTMDGSAAFAGDDIFVSKGYWTATKEQSKIWNQVLSAFSCTHTAATMAAELWSPATKVSITRDDRSLNSGGRDLRQQITLPKLM